MVVPCGRRVIYMQMMREMSELIVEFYLFIPSPAPRGVRPATFREHWASASYMGTKLPCA